MLYFIQIKKYQKERKFILYSKECIILCLRGKIIDRLVRVMLNVPVSFSLSRYLFCDNIIVL